MGGDAGGRDDVCVLRGFDLREMAQSGQVSAEASIRRHEGYREFPYQDTLGIWTVGHGINIHSMPIPSYTVTVGELLDWITDPVLHENWFQKRFDEAKRGAKHFAGEAWESLSEARRDVLIEMVFQLGYPRLSGFKRFRKALQEGKWVVAEKEMLDSQWAEQTPARAHELASRFLEG